MRIKKEALDLLPGVDEQKVDELFGKERAGWKKKIIVLDDDPTGVQTVHDISVYTQWDEESMEQGFMEDEDLFYILTNSRAMTEEETKEVHRQIADMAEWVSVKTGKEYLFISRCDSTLRGHYPLETQILREAYWEKNRKEIDGEILCPFFKEGGRVTIGNVHYVAYGEELIPVNETEFAGDQTFGFCAKTLPEYVEEKTKGRYRSGDVICISLEELRNLEIDRIEEKLEKAGNFRKIIVNAVDYVDLKIFCVALYRAMKKGKRYLFRTAASFVRILGDISEQPLLTKKRICQTMEAGAGLILAGSHTAKTTAQISALKELPFVHMVCLNVQLVKDHEKFEKEMERCHNEVEKYLREGRTVCCYTTRKLITADTGDKEDELKLAVKISEALMSFVGKLGVAPAFLIAKGGITSSDVGTKALGVRKARVLGQIKPGIPVWETGRESRFPGMPYIIFPGNVGEENTLKEIVELLAK